jgi:Family of unknown function (DUF6437)
MAKAKVSALDALRKVHAQRSQLDAKESELRQQAAGELGQIVLECSAEQIDPAQLRSLLKAAVRLGSKEALERLTAPQ